MNLLWIKEQLKNTAFFPSMKDPFDAFFSSEWNVLLDVTKTFSPLHYGFFVLFCFYTFVLVNCMRWFQIIFFTFTQYIALPFSIKTKK